MAGGAGQVEQADLDLHLGPERVVSCAEVLMCVSIDSLSHCVAARLLILLRPG